jgi:hypothetical protein
MASEGAANTFARPGKRAHTLRACILSWIALSVGSWLALGIVIYGLIAMFR